MSKETLHIMLYVFFFWGGGFGEMKVQQVGKYRIDESGEVVLVRIVSGDTRIS